jgi:glycosyltransferase involved in cell wall biosynthesis
MKNNQELVSVIMPVYNGEAYLSDAINSVLDQKYNSMELIVIDDGSTDRSAEIVKIFGKKVQYFFQKNSGTADARNHGIRVANGSFFAFLDQDDLWIKDKLLLQISAFKSEPELDIVFGHVQQFLSPDISETLKQNLVCPPSRMPGYLPSAILMKRETFFKVGNFESSWQIGEWADWYVRASELTLKMKMLPELVAMRRIHAGNKGVLQRNSINEYVHILKASLDRRRTDIINETLPNEEKL